MRDLENTLLMEVFDDGTLEEYDFSIIEDKYVQCARCKKIEIPPEDDEYGAEDGIYHCIECRKQKDTKD